MHNTVRHQFLARQWLVSSASWHSCQSPTQVLKMSVTAQADLVDKTAGSCPLDGASAPICLNTSRLCDRAIQCPDGSDEGALLE